MLETKNVFIDTECYVRSKLNLDTSAFRKFKALCKYKDLNHITTTTVVLEVERKIEESIKEATNALIKFQRHAQILNTLNDEKLAPLFEVVDENSVKDRALHVFSKFLNECNSDIAYAEDIDGEDILERYFERKPPFNKDKDNEFRDSISMLSLKNKLAETSSKSYVVSGDKALKDYCEDEQNLIYVESLEQMLDLYNRHTSMIADKVQTYIDENIDGIEGEIIDYLNNCDVYNNSNWEDSEVESFEFCELVDIEPSIITIDEEQCQINLDFSVRLNAVVTGPDYINGIYDKEEGVMFTLGTTTQDALINLDYFAELTIYYEFNDGKLIDVEYDELSIPDTHKGIEISVEENEEDYN